MTTARNIDPNGTVELVQLPGTPYRPGHHYYSPQHHQNLVCTHCDAKVHFNKGTESLLGSFKGRSSHFHTNRGQEHQSCLWPLRDPTQSEESFDKNKGYRIHINTLSHTFNRYSGVYGRNAAGHIVAYEPDLKDREAFSVTGIEGLKTLMIKGEFDRLKDSKVIFSNKAVAWSDFCLYLEKEERYVALKEKLRIAGKRGPASPVLMEIRIPEPHRPKFPSERGSFNASPIKIGTDHRGFSERIVPSIQLQHNHNTYLRDIFDRAGTYLVLGVPRLNTKEMDFVTNHYLNIAVTDARQVHFGNMKELALTAKANAAKRAAKQDVLTASP